MRIAMIGHSLIHIRQQFFCEALRKQGCEVLEIYPNQWATLKREGGFNISFGFEGGGMAGHFFPEEAFERIKEFKPDLIYSMSEWWQTQSEVSLRWARRLNVPIAYFMWENLRKPTSAPPVIKKADLIIAGNQGCREIARKYNKNVFVLPQVGIDTKNLFKPVGHKKKADLVFAANRMVPEKGYAVLEKLKKDYKVIVPDKVPYEKMYRVYNKAKLHICLSYRIKEWAEQFAPFCNIEAMACGLPTLTTDSGAIKDWLSLWTRHLDRKYITCIPESWSRDERADLIKKEIDVILRGKDYKQKSREARKFALGFDNEVIAKKLIGIFEGI